MKTLFTIALTFLIQASLFSQKWDNTYGSSNYDEQFDDIIESYDNGYLISGGKDVLIYHGLILKTDLNGDLLWEKYVQHNQFDVGGGGISQNSFGELVTVSALFTTNGAWPVITKLDECGNKLWCRSYIEDEYDWGLFYDAILFESGDIIALCKLWSSTNTENQIFLYYINSEGNLIWKKSYASEDNHPLLMGSRDGKKLIRINDGYMIVGTCYYPNPGNPNIGYLRPLFIRTDNDFKEMWILPFGINYNFVGHGHDVIALSDSTYMGVGGYGGTNLLYFNNDGDDLGFKEILNEDIGPNIGVSVTGSISRINDSLFITSTVFGPDQFSASWGEIIIDSSGNVYNVESRANTVGNAKICKTFDDKFIIGCNYDYPNSNKDIYLYKINENLEQDTLYNGSYDYDSLCPYQIQSGIVDITDCLLITNVGETPTPEEYFAFQNTVIINAYPNPSVDGIIHLAYQNADKHDNLELRCYNLFGGEVHRERVYRHQGESIVKLTDWGKGLYLAVIYSNGKQVGKVKFMKSNQK